MQPNTEKLTKILSGRALNIMAARMNVTPDHILVAIMKDRNGQAAIYFQDLLQMGLQAAQDQQMLAAMPP